jgi:CheY-like chemotaxis protein
MKQTGTVAILNLHEPLGQWCRESLEASGWKCSYLRLSQLAADCESYLAIVLAMQTPEASLIEALRAALPTTPLCAVVEQADPRQVLRLFEAGVDDCLLPPHQPQHLNERLAQLLGPGDETDGSPTDGVSTAAEPFPAIAGAAPPAIAPQPNLQSYVRSMQSQMLAMMSHLSHVAVSAAGTTTDKPVCQFFHCPRRQALEAAVKDAIETLERTRRAFKSRELAELRQRLESVLENSEDFTPSS